MDLTILYYLIPSLFMFCCGVYGFITRRNMIAMLVSLELMLNSVDINFVVFNRFLFPGEMEGMFFSRVEEYRCARRQQNEILRRHATSNSYHYPRLAACHVPLPGTLRP